MDIFYSVGSLLSQGWLHAVLFASVMFAGGVFIDELLLKEQKVGTLVIISAFFGAILMVIFAVAAFFTGDSLSFEASYGWWALLIGVGEMAWAIPYLYANKRRGAVVVGPMFQLIPVIGGLAEAIIFGIIPPAIQVLGAILIVGGGFFLSLEEEELADGTVKYVSDWTTVGLMMIAVIIAAVIYVLFRGTALDGASYVAIGFWSGFGMVLTGLVIYLVWKPYREAFNAFSKNANGKMVGLQLVNECADTGGAYLTHLANVIGPSVLVVTAFNAAQPIFILVIAAVLLFFGIKVWDMEYKWKIIVPSILAIAIGTGLIALN